MGICTLNAGAITITNFPESSFTIVDNTQLVAGTAGYRDSLDAEGRTIFILTDTFPTQSLAAWYGQQLDLNKDFKFDFQIYFDIGKSQPGSVPHNRRAAAGICFVLTTLSDLDSLIGAERWCLGYGIGCSPSVPPITDEGATLQSVNVPRSHISPSFAIEFDSECGERLMDDPSNATNYDDCEYGYDVSGASLGYNQRHHISYLKNGYMRALSGTYGQLQNNWANVTTGQWYCVTVVWKKMYDTSNTTPYWTMDTWINNKTLTTYPNGSYAFQDAANPTLRCSKRFDSLGALIDGLSIDPATNTAYVNWGFTAATDPTKANKHMIRPIHFTDTLSQQQPPANSLMGDSARILIAPPYDYSGTPTIINSTQYTSDAYSYEISAYCGMVWGISSVTGWHFSADTITYPIICNDVDLPHITLQDGDFDTITWQYKCAGIDNDDSIWHIRADDSHPDSVFSVIDYHNLCNTDSMTVMLITGSDTTYFNFRFNSSQTLYQYFNDTSNIDDTQIKNGNMTITNFDSEYNIPLPDSDCPFSIQLSNLSDTSYFAEQPTITTSGNINFKVKDTTCGRQIILKINRNCLSSECQQPDSAFISVYTVVPQLTFDTLCNGISCKLNNNICDTNSVQSVPNLRFYLKDSAGNIIDNAGSIADFNISEADNYTISYKNTITDEEIIINDNINITSSDLRFIDSIQIISNGRSDSGTCKYGALLFYDRNHSDRGIFRMITSTDNGANSDTSYIVDQYAGSSRTHGKIIGTFKVPAGDSLILVITPCRGARSGMDADSIYNKYDTYCEQRIVLSCDALSDCEYTSYLSTNGQEDYRENPKRDEQSNLDCIFPFHLIMRNGYTLDSISYSNNDSIHRDNISSGTQQTTNISYIDYMFTLVNPCIKDKNTNWSPLDLVKQKYITRNVTFHLSNPETGDTCDIVQTFECGCWNLAVDIGRDPDILVGLTANITDSPTIPINYGISFKDPSITTLSKEIVFKLYSGYGDVLNNNLYTLQPSGSLNGQFIADMTNYVAGTYFITAETIEGLAGFLQFNKF
jgi:hypothetical protein